MSVLILQILVIIFGIIGIFDTSFLTIEHYQNIVPPCGLNTLFYDCGKVLNSEWSVILGVPTSLIGLIYYILLTCLLLGAILYKRLFAKIVTLILSFGGVCLSLFFIYLQLFVIRAICGYCMISALISFLIFTIIQILFKQEQKRVTVFLGSIFYKYYLRSLLFRFDPEFIHKKAIQVGNILGQNLITRLVLSYLFGSNDSVLKQRIHNIDFKSPIGLAAGFDYEAKLTQVLPCIGFGFATVGTITNLPYEGNKRPILGRLPKSKSLMVNKGFKNLGARVTVSRLHGQQFAIPIGVSIGQTNTQEIQTVKEGIDDIVKSFICFEVVKAQHSYYELNISCPNLTTNVSFYQTENLESLLTAIDQLKLTRPVFIKMPIDKSDLEVLRMLDVIVKHSVDGVIFGNLQKNRNHPLLNPEEVRKFPVGSFSGKPTFERSNQLIELAYKSYKNQLTIIGCGGVFSVEDAYKKICLGASLVQLITGMIFVGPQLIADINIKLVALLRKDGYDHIAQAIGCKVQI